MHLAVRLRQYESLNSNPRDTMDNLSKPSEPLPAIGENFVS
jgi:hypothetical protein